MSKDKQITEMAEFMTEGARPAIEDAEALYNAGYRKIYDDHQRQCTCYALGCQMAEGLKHKVAREIFEEIESCIWSETHYGDSKLCFEINSAKYAELKKKYAEEKK